MTQLEILKKELGKPYHDLEFMLLCLKDVLKENNEFELAKMVPWICNDCNFESFSFSQKHFHLFSVAFQLLNLAETNGAVQNRRKREEEHSLTSINGLWSSTLEILKENNFSQTQILETLKEIEVRFL